MANICALCCRPAPRRADRPALGTSPGAAGCDPRQRPRFIPMYYRLFRWFPKRAFSRLLGRLASIASPRWLLQPAIRVYIAAFRINISQKRNK